MDVNGLMAPVTVTPQDHGGGGKTRIEMWDGSKWVAADRLDCGLQGRGLEGREGAVGRICQGRDAEIADTPLPTAA